MIFLPQKDDELYDSGTQIARRALQPEKAFVEDNPGSEEPRYETDAKLLHHAKTLLFIEDTVDGMSMDLKLLQLEKA